jgi:hypothetical protein
VLSSDGRTTGNVRRGAVRQVEEVALFGCRLADVAPVLMGHKDKKERTQSTISPKIGMKRERRKRQGRRKRTDRVVTARGESLA